MLATAWKDKRMVYYLSTAHAPHEEEPQSVTWWQRDGTEVELPCPPTVAAYAQYMNGMDKLDQMTRQNKSKKCMKWYRRVETKLMETSLYNVYVIEGHAINHKVGNVVKCNFLSFGLDLAHKLVWGSLCGEGPSWQTTHRSQWQRTTFGSNGPLAGERWGQGSRLWGVQCMTQAPWTMKPRCVILRQPLQTVKDDHEMRKV